MNIEESIQQINELIEAWELNEAYLNQRIDIFKEILKKYNEKVTDINVGSMGGKE